MSDPGDAIFPVQEAIYARLKALAPPLAGGRIHDVPLQPTKRNASDTQHPLVEIGEVEAQEADTGRAGIDEVLTLHVWSRQRGQREILSIMHRMKAEMHKTRLAVPGWDSMVWWRNTLTMQDPDGISQHGVIRFRILSLSEEI